MERVLILFMILITLHSCESQRCEHISEIGFIYNLKNDEDRQSICKAYELNRELFFSLKNDADKYGIFKIEEILSQSNVSQKAINEFIEYWQTMAREHRSQTLQRDSTYVEGVLCLKKLIEEKHIEWNKFLELNRKLIESSLTKSQIQRIRQGIDDYRSFNKVKKKQFLKEETLLFGKLGKNIISYNQLSFDVIDQFMTSQYRFGFKNNYTKHLIEFYNDNETLNKIFVKYRQLEEKIIEELTSEECFKRVGILRYYDGLNEEKREKAIRINMLMNMLK